MKKFLNLFFLPFVLARNGTIQYHFSSKRHLRGNGIATFYNVFENACQFQDLYDNLLKVAISGSDWNNGEKCGTCVEIIGKGNGIGTTPFEGYHKSIITNICPECPPGHFDLLHEGDGIWDIEYNFVPCLDVGIFLPPIQYRLETNNDYYIRLQIINTEREIQNVFVENTPMEKTFDNFWTHYNARDVNENPTFQYPLSIRIELVDGTIHEGTIYNNEQYTNLN